MTKATLSLEKLKFMLRAFIGVETAALTFRTREYSTGHYSHTCYGKQFCNDFFLNHNTIPLVYKRLRNFSAVWSLKLLWTEWAKINNNFL